MADVEETLQEALALGDEGRWEEMAGVLATSESAVKARLHRAREMMAQQMARRRTTQSPGGLERRVAGHALSASA